MSYRKKIIQYEEETEIQEDRQMQRIREIFPYDNPYDQQIESMKVILDTLNKKQNLLFQSPTGTGKSLMVMCSAATFAEKYPSQYQILFLTRTNGQVNGLIKELNKIRNIDSFISKYSILAGRNNLCIKKDQFKQYVIQNNIDPNEKNLYKKYEMFCTDCKKCLVKTTASKNLDNENILNVSKTITIDLASKQKQQQQKKREQIFSAMAEDLNSDEIDQDGKVIPSKELACLHFGLNEILKEQEYKFEGYSKVQYINTQNNSIPKPSPFEEFNEKKKSQHNNLSFNLKNHKDLIQMIEKHEEQDEDSQELEQEEEQKQNFINNQNKTQVEYKSNQNNQIFNQDKYLQEDQNQKIEYSNNISEETQNNNNNQFEERLPDIEDMVQIFKEKQGQCPFYFNRYIAKQSNIVFMNYNYLLNPDILTYVSANIIDRQKKQIIIFDEAHNIEQQAESQFQTKLKMRNLQKAHDLITSVLITLRLAKQLRLIDVVKQKGLELLEKIKSSNKSKLPEKNDKEKLDNLNNYEIQLKEEQNSQSLNNNINNNENTQIQEEQEEEFIPQSFQAREKSQNLFDKSINQENNSIEIERNDIDEIKYEEQEISNNINISNDLQDIPLNCLKPKDINIVNNGSSKYSPNNIFEKLTDQSQFNNKVSFNNIFESNTNQREIQEDEEDIEIINMKQKIQNDLRQNLQFIQNNGLKNEVEENKNNEFVLEEERELIETIKKENIIRETIKIEEDEEMNEIAVDINQNKINDYSDKSEESITDKYEIQKRTLEDFIDNYEIKLPLIQNYLNKLISFSENRNQKSQKAESNLLSEYHFITKYYTLFGLSSQQINEQNKENITKQEDKLNSSNNENNNFIKDQPNQQKSILQEATEVLNQRNNPNEEYEQNMELLDQFSEFSYIFQQTMRYIKVKYSRECQQKAIEDILGSAVYYEGNVYQLNVSIRYFANNLQPLKHLTKIKKILAFLKSLQEFYQLSQLQQRFKKRINIQKPFNQINPEFNLESPDLQKLQDFYFAIQKNEVKNDLVFTIGCLSGKYAFREIFSRLNVHSLILSSGTLEPFDVLSKNLDIKFQIYSGQHVIKPEEQVFSQFIKESNDNGTKLNFSFDKLYMDDIEIREQKQQNISSALRIMQNIVSIILEKNIKGGILVFFKSYELMYNFYKSFLGSETQKVLKDIPLFYEKSSNTQFQQDFVQFKRYVQILKKTSIFFAACRGKLAEGIDLNDDLARCVLLVGVPLWNISDPYYICKKKYVELVLKMDSNEWSRKQVIKCVNQAAGRSIRHRSDWGSVFFICEQFDQVFHPKNFKKYISKWILLGENRQQDYLNAFKSFLTKNSQNSFQKMI